MRMHTLTCQGVACHFKALSILKQKAMIALLLLWLECITVGSNSGQCLVSCVFLYHAC